MAAQGKIVGTLLRRWSSIPRSVGAPSHWVAKFLYHCAKARPGVFVPDRETVVLLFSLPCTLGSGSPQIKATVRALGSARGRVRRQYDRALIRRNAASRLSMSSKETRTVRNSRCLKRAQGAAASAHESYRLIDHETLSRRSKAEFFADVPEIAPLLLRSDADREWLRFLQHELSPVLHPRIRIETDRTARRYRAALKSLEPKG